MYVPHEGQLVNTDGSWEYKLIHCCCRWIVTPPSNIHEWWSLCINCTEISELSQTSLYCNLFSCTSGVSNEARFVFTVQSIIMPQKLKGTLTFIVKVSWKTYMYMHTHILKIYITIQYSTTKGIRFLFYLLIYPHTVYGCWYTLIRLQIKAVCSSSRVYFGNEPFTQIFLHICTPEGPQSSARWFTILLLFHRMRTPQHMRNWTSSCTLPVPRT